MVAQTALAILLNKLGAGDDIATGFAIAGRSDPAVDELIGLFINTLVLRVRIGANPTLAQLLEQVRATSLAAFDHQDVPFETLVEHHNPTRSLTRHPLIQVMLAWQNFTTPSKTAPTKTAALGPLDASIIPLTTHTARMDIVISLRERFTATNKPAGVDGFIEYRTDVFDRATIEAFVDSYLHILDVLATDPQQLLSTIDVLNTAQHACLDQWGNRAVLTQPANTTIQARVSIPELFSDQVACAPEAIAVRFNSQSWTYRDLDTNANQIANVLTDQGVSAGDVVGVLLPRSPHAVIAIMAVLKTGATYLPIDPHYPASRIGFLLDDTTPAVVITTTNLHQLLDGLGDQNPRVLDIDDPQISSCAQTPPPTPAPVRAENIAYLIYTSGTTGTPKGVAITHGHIITVLRGMAATTPSVLASDQIWTQCHSYSFDFSVWEIFGALLHGATLVIVPDTVTTNPTELHALLIDEHVTVFSQTPSAFYAFHDADQASGLAADQLQVKTVILGGEAFYPQRLQPWLAKYSNHPQLINAYGPTETTFCVSVTAPLSPEGLSD